MQALGVCQMYARAAEKATFLISQGNKGENLITINAL